MYFSSPFDNSSGSNLMYAHRNRFYRNGAGPDLRDEHYFFGQHTRAVASIASQLVHFFYR
jgi:hypothetical protein